MATYTPVPFWLGMPLVRLEKWFAAARDVVREDART